MDIARYQALHAQYSVAPRELDRHLNGLVGGPIFSIVGGCLGVLLVTVFASLAFFDVVGWAVAGGTSVTLLLVAAFVGWRVDVARRAKDAAMLRRGRLGFGLVLKAQPCVTEEPGSWSPAIVLGMFCEPSEIDQLQAVADRVFQESGSAYGRWAELIRGSELEVFGYADVPESAAGRSGVFVAGMNVSTKYAANKQLPPGQGVVVVVAEDPNILQIG